MDALSIPNSTQGNGEMDTMGEATTKPVLETTIEELYAVIVFLALLSVMGTAGNALVLYVFSKKKDKLVSTLFIIVLAFVDFTTCLIVIPYTIYMEYTDMKIQYDFLCKAYKFLITSNIPFSAQIMVAIAIDRYFCICHPFLHAMNIQRAKIMIAALGIFATALGICVALMHGVYELHVLEIPARNLTINGSYISHYEMDGINSSAMPEIAANQSSYTIIQSSGRNITVPLYRGQCVPNNIILNDTFFFYFQKLYMSQYIVCLVVVIILYALIYRSVLARRSKRQKQKSKSLQLVLATTASTEPNGDHSVEETMLTTANGESRVDTVVKNGPKGSATVAAKAKQDGRNKPTRKSTKKDRMHMANLKTAAMLFVVTIVFIVTFIPAFLMAMEIIGYQMFVFYLYFANNVANPVIYSFMNKNFRDDLRKLFC